jgi:hypothetical protein
MRPTSYNKWWCWYCSPRGKKMAEFTIRGRNYSIQKEKIISALKKVRPEPITKYYVEVNNGRYPIKQVLSEACNIDRIAFTSMDAYRILDNLGFRIKTIK